MNFLLILTIIYSFAIIQQINAQECLVLDSKCDGFLSENCCSGLACASSSCQAVQKIQGELAQCGGKYFSNLLRCSNPLKCVFFDEWYSQYQFIQDNQLGNIYQLRWSQCDGLQYAGNKKCYPGLTCLYVNDWWSSCELVLGEEKIEEEKPIIVEDPVVEEAIVEEPPITEDPVEEEAIVEEQPITEDPVEEEVIIKEPILDSEDEPTINDQPETIIDNSEEDPNV